MSATQFGRRYARVYDSVYADRPYKEEVDRLVKIFRRFGVRHVLDLGCGTGTHAAMLAELGYHVVGVDASPFMLSVARRKSKRVRWVRQDMRELDLGEVFDAAVALFTVFGYLDPRELREVLGRVGQHLRWGGLLCFDVWRSPFVPERKRTRRRAGGVLRESRVEYNPLRLCWDVRFTFRTPRGSFEETHRIHAYSERELGTLLGRAGFGILETNKRRGRDLWVVAKYTP